MKKYDSINVIPFIDIMLVLLAIVLTTATFVTNKNQLDLDLPTSSSATTADNTEQVEIAVNREGVLFINNIENSLESAEQQLRLLSTDASILLLMDETVEVKQFIALIDVLKKLSLNKVSVLTRANS